MLSTLGNYLWSSTESPLEQVSFTINGKPYTVGSKTVPADTSLNTFIRNHALLRGTKFMCFEGGCGTCSVTIQRIHPVSKERTTFAVNSCLFPVLACHGLEITTIEGVGNRKDGYHPLQEKLSHFNGTQCGMCSPGMVMTMYSLMKANHGKVSMAEVENSLGGNICRCTGYRPILDAFKSMATDTENVCADIEDLPKKCPKSGSVCSGNCTPTDDKKQIHVVFDDNKEWFRVFTIQDVFTIFNQIGEKPYILVCGNTAHGVYRNRDDLQVFIDVNAIEELHSNSIADTITVDGNVSLTEFMVVLTDAANKNPHFSYCKELVKHIDKTAHPLVRNVGSVAGNLSIKNQHREFPSDIYLLLEAIGATITILESSSRSTSLYPKDYILTDMRKKVVKSVVLPPLDPDSYVFRSYKVTQRAQNAHAYVNGGFLLKFNANKTVVESARICFGGINPEFTHAKETEHFLIGKNLFDNNSVQAALVTLTNELNPDWVLPDASAEYRKNLAVSLFYKFILNIAPQDRVFVSPQFKSGGTMLERPISNGKQFFDTYEKNWPLTQNVPKIEGLAQCSGEAEYINDLPPFPRELFAAFVQSTQTHSKIANIDASVALELPGVAAFFSAKDIPGTNNFAPQSLGFLEVEEILCSGEVLFNGQPVGLIVAETFEIASKAVKLVEITYERLDDDELYPTLKALMLADPDKRVCSASHEVIGETYGLKKLRGTQTVKGRMELAGQAHYHMETQTCVCVPIEDGMDVYPSTQWMDVIQIAISEMLKMAQNKVNIYVRRVGGSFGSKISRATQVACAAALAAHLTNRPVRFYLSFEANMETFGKRYGCFTDYEVAVDKYGKIAKLTNYFAQDYGISFNEPLGVTTTAFFPNCYDSKSWKIVGKMVKTDAGKNTWCRAPATTESIGTTETIMEHIAHETGRDPLEVRYANMPKDSKLRTLIPDFLKQIEFDSRKRSVDDFNANNRWKKRGIAHIPQKYFVEYFGTVNALVSIFQGDGTVVVTHGGIELGQGINTKVAQVTAFMLGIALDKVNVKYTSNWTSVNAVSTGGSITSETVCYAAKEACNILLARIKPFRERHAGVPWEQLVKICFAESVDLTANFMYKAQDTQPYNIWGLGSAEVEVDILTGNILIRRMDIQEDTGESLSPGVDLGQIEGSIVMGIGYHLTEDLIFDGSTGKLLTNRTWNYKVPGALDIPVDLRVSFLRGSSNPAGVLRSKATAEPAVNLAIVVLFALRYALRSARSDAGLPDDWIPLGSGTTPEKIFLQAGNDVQQYLLRD